MDRLHVTIPLLFIMLLAAVARPADLQKVYVPHGWKCERCDLVKAVLARNGVKTVSACEMGDPGKEPAYYPRCHYSDGYTDNGSLVLDGDCEFSKTVYVLEWIEKKPKKGKRK